MHAESNEPRPESLIANDMPEGEEKPPRGAKVVAALRWLLLLGVLGTAAYTNVTYFFTERGEAAASAAKYYCPMHPQITSDRTGECPICHMALEPIPTDRLSSAPAAEAHAHHGHAHEGHEAHGGDTKAGKYICPMCPGVENDGPGECPVCHMALEPASADQPSSAPAGEAHAHHGHAHEGHEAHGGDTKAGKYICPMCPGVENDGPGECPICHMALEPEKKGEAAGQPAKESTPAHPPKGTAGEAHVHGEKHEHAHGPKYTCPMHPEVLQDGPGRCPICRMYLERVRDESEQVTEGVTPGTTPSGTVPVVLGLDRVQAIGVRTTRVAKQSADAPLRVTATVTAPEQGQAFVHARAAGYIERANVQQTGVRVRRGQELVTIYSPEIFQAQAELLSSHAWRGQQGDFSQDAARTKLELLGVSSRTIERILESKKPLRAVPITSPVGGWVVKKNVALGSYVTPDMPLFEIVDLSRVYVTAEVFPKDADRVELKSEARFTLAGRDGKSFTGTIDLVYPTLSPKERTTRIRMQVKNAKAELRPGDYGTIEIASKAGDTLVVPRDAIVDTGSSTYVFVVEGEGRYVPRVVALGTDFDDVVEVKDGVFEGESVVSSATFLIDSESRLQASLASLTHAH